MALLNVDLEILQETKLTHNIYMQAEAGYRDVATEVVSALQGGVALFWRECIFFKVEEVVKNGPIIITVQVVMAADQYHHTPKD